SPLENEQTISTPVNVDGVTVQVNCGHCQHLDKENHRGYHAYHHEVYDCTLCFCHLLKKIQQVQQNADEAELSGVNFYHSSINAVENPLVDQVITNINECCTVNFKSADQESSIPRLTVKLENITGVSVESNEETNEDNVFTDILDEARNLTEQSLNSC